MIELLKNLNILKNVELNLSTLSMAGIRYGLPANEFPLHLVREVTLAPIIESSHYSSESSTKYFDKNNNEISKRDVIQSAIEESGCLHIDGNISFFIRNGNVSHFSLYGPQKQHFSYIKNLKHLISEFGKPDILKSSDAYGEIFNSKLFTENRKKYNLESCWK